MLKHRRIPAKYVEDIEDAAARLLAENKIVGWFQGRMESGPRPLGNRSILMSAENKKNKDIINTKVKYREKLPAVLSLGSDRVRAAVFRRVQA